MRIQQGTCQELSPKNPQVQAFRQDNFPITHPKHWPVSHHAMTIIGHPEHPVLSFPDHETFKAIKSHPASHELRVDVIPTCMSCQSATFLNCMHQFSIQQCFQFTNLVKIATQHSSDVRLAVHIFTAIPILILIKFAKPGLIASGTQAVNAEVCLNSQSHFQQS